MLQDPNNELNLLQTDGSSATADSEKVTSEASHWLSMRAVDVLDNTTDAFIALDSEWRILFANRTACAINKKPLSDFVGRTHWEEWPASVGTVVEENYRRAAADQVDVHFTHHYSNAEYDVWLEIDAYPLPDGLNVFYRDITAKHQSDRLVEESERKFRALADNIAQLAWMADGTGSIFWYNQRWYDYTGTTFEQMQGWGWDKVHRPDLLPGIIERFKACLESGAVWEDTFPLLSSDGVFNWFLSRAFPIFDASGKVVLWCGTNTDITALRETREALERSQEDLQIAIDAAQLGTFYNDWPQGTIIWNDKCKEHFFLKPDANVDFPLFYSLLHPDDRENHRRAITRAMTERVPYNIEYRVVASDGRVRWINSVGRGRFSDDGTPIRFDGVTIDVTERKVREQELARRAQRDELLNQIGQAIRTTQDPRDIELIALRALGIALHVDRCYVAHLDHASDTVTIGEDYRTQDLYSLSGSYAVSDWALNVDELFSNGKPLVINNIDRSELPSEAVERTKRLGLQSLINIPLIRDSRVVAILGLGQNGSEREWTDFEVELANEVAVLVRRAIEAARTVMREHAIAEQLQAALQPATPRDVPGLTLANYYRPALEDQGVGGDFSDVFEVDSQSTYLVVGDLSGKGLSAASQVAMVRHMLRYALYNGSGIAQAVTSLNETLTHYNLISGFSTLFIGRFEAHSQKLSYVNCGQDAALVLSAKTGGITKLATTGPVLGMDRLAKFDEAETYLRFGDVVAIFTDGLTEAGPNRTQLLAGEGVEALLRQQSGQTDPDVVISNLIAGVDTFSASGLRDDQCLLVAVVSQEAQLELSNTDIADHGYPSDCTDEDASVPQSITLDRESRNAWRRLAGLQSVTEALAESTALDEITKVVLEQGLPIMGANAGSIALLTADSRELEIIQYKGYSEELVAPFRKFSVALPMPMCDAAVNHNAVYLENWQQWQNKYPPTAPEGATRQTGNAWAALPLVVKNVAIGAIGLTFLHERTFSTDDRAFMQALARQCALAVDRTMLMQNAARSEQRMAFLAQVSTVLAESLDYQSTLRTLARLVVPDLADWCSVDVFGVDGTLERLAVEHVDPEKVKFGLDLQNRNPPDPNAATGLYNVMRTGKSEFYPEITDEMLTSSVSDPDILASIRELSFRSAMVVPLIARERTLGVISFITTSESEKRYTEEDLTFAEEVAKRAALAVDNARLFRDAQEERARQRQFLREILLSVSEKKLHLCDDISDLPPQLKSVHEFNGLISTQLSQVRAATRAAAESQNFSDARWQDLVTAVSEAGMNAVVHAAGGEITICEGNGTIQVWITDKGSGIAVQYLHRATLERGFTTSGTLGHGFWMMLRLVDRLWLLTGLSGTTLVLEQDRVPPEPQWLNVET